MKNINRRKFITSSLATAGALAVQSCTGNKNQEHSLTGKNPIKIADPNQGLSREEIMLMLDQKVDYYMAQSYHCAQSSFLALSEQFSLGNKDIVKALTPFPGLAETGKTCGALIGSLMVIGLVFGRDRIDDWKKYRESLIPSGDFVTAFENKEGSTNCAEIVEKEFGKRYNLRDPAEQQEFVAAGATEKCGKVVKNAVHMAAGIILDYYKVSDSGTH